MSTRIFTEIRKRLTDNPYASIEDLRAKLLKAKNRASNRMSNMLSPQERVEALKLLAGGQRDYDVAELLGVTRTTLLEEVRHSMEVIRERHRLPQGIFSVKHKDRYAKAWAHLTGKKAS